MASISFLISWPSPNQMRRNSSSTGSSPRVVAFFTPPRLGNADGADSGGDGLLRCRAGCHLDLAGFGLFAHWDHNAEYAVVVVGGDRRRVDSFAEAELPQVGAVRALLRQPFHPVVRSSGS